MPEVALVVSALIILCMQESSQPTARLEAKKRKLWKGLYADLNRLAVPVCGYRIDMNDRGETNC